MAFVTAPGAVLARSTNFSGGSASAQRTARALRGPRMAGLTDKERISFAKVGSGSQWRENVFVGGFPGGEEAYQQWVEGGMKDDVPDLPEYLQAKTPFEQSVDSKKKVGVLERLDKLDFLPGFFGGKDAVVDEAVPAEAVPAEAAAAEVATAEVAAAEKVVDENAPPDERLYEQWYPKETRYLAPMISIVYQKDYYKDKVGVAMGEVTADATDLRYPKYRKNMAPIIKIDYNGSSLAGAGVTVSMAEIEAPPSIAPPVANGETVTKLVPGPGGGLKLDFEVQGEGAVNVYSDPRAIEKFNSMVQ